MADPFGDVIYAYTVEDGVADGTYQEVTWLARLLGYKVPVFLTEGVANLCGLEAAYQRSECGEKDATYQEQVSHFLLAMKAVLPERSGYHDFPVDQQYQNQNIVCGLNQNRRGQPVLVFCLLEED